MKGTSSPKAQVQAEIKLQAEPQIKPISQAVNNNKPRKNTIKVRAPADLEEGYTFTVKVKGGIITAPVPKGGVKKGEIFLIPRSM